MYMDCFVMIDRLFYYDTSYKNINQFERIWKNRWTLLSVKRLHELAVKVSSRL